MPVLKTYIAGQWVDIGGSTNPMTTAGDIIIGGVSGVPERLAKGTDGQVLTVVAGVPAYAAASGGSATIDWTSPVVVSDTANLAYGKHHIVAVTAADKTLTLPEITASDYGKMIVVEIAAATTKFITIDGYAAQAIDGALARVMWASEVAQLVATTVGWTKVGGKSIPIFAGLYHSGTVQLFNTGTATKSDSSNIQTGSADLAVDVANKQLVAARDGLYIGAHKFRCNSTNTAVAYLQTQFNVNGATRTQMTGTMYNAASQTLAASAAFPIFLNKADRVEHYLFYTSTNSFTTSVVLNALPAHTNISITEVPIW